MDGAARQTGDALELLWSRWDGAEPVQIADVGANPIEGEAPYAALLGRGYVRLTGFEPQDEERARLDAVKSEHETYHPQALGDGKKAKLHVFNHSGFTSLYPADPDRAAIAGFARSTREVAVLPVETSRMDDLEAIPQIDYLKIDVQGAEKTIIKHGKAKLSEAVLVQTEVRFMPVYKGEPSFGELDVELRRQGFCLHDFAFLKRVGLRSPSHGALKRSTFKQIVDGDAYYIRDLAGAADWSEAQLFKLAILAHDILKSPNLVVFLLDALADKDAKYQGLAAEYLSALPAAMRKTGKAAKTRGKGKA